MIFGVIFRYVQRAEAFLLSASILLMASLTILNVVTRTLFGRSLAWVTEINSFLMVVVTFIGLSYAASVGRHVRMTAVYDQLGQRARKVVMTSISASTALLLFVLAWYAVTYVQTIATLGTVSPALQLPLWWVYAVVPLGLTLGGVQYLLATARNLLEDDVYISYDRTDAYEDPVVPGI